MFLLGPTDLSPPESVSQLRKEQITYPSGPPLKWRRGAGQAAKGDGMNTGFGA